LNLYILDVIYNREVTSNVYLLPTKPYLKKKQRMT